MGNHSNHVPSQFPAFRLTVARQMEGYRDRIARRIRSEAARRGESAMDLAHALQVHSSTTERWLRGERTPQRRHRKQLAEHWALPFEEFEPDLAAEEQELRNQLDRMETMLGRLLDHFKISRPEEPAEVDGPVAVAELEDPATVAEQTADAVEQERESARRQKRSA